MTDGQADGRLADGQVDDRLTDVTGASLCLAYQVRRGQIGHDQPAVAVCRHCSSNCPSLLFFER